MVFALFYCFSVLNRNKEKKKKNLLFQPHSKSRPPAHAGLLTPHSFSSLGFTVNNRLYTFPSACSSGLFPARPHREPIDLKKRHPLEAALRTRAHFRSLEYRPHRHPGSTAFASLTVRCTALIGLWSRLPSDAIPPNTPICGLPCPPPPGRLPESAWLSSAYLGLSAQPRSVGSAPIGRYAAPSLSVRV